MGLWEGLDHSPALGLQEPMGLGGQAAKSCVHCA